MFLPVGDVNVATIDLLNLASFAVFEDNMLIGEFQLSLGLE